MKIYEKLFNACACGEFLSTQTESAETSKLSSMIDDRVIAEIADSDKQNEAAALVSDYGAACMLDGFVAGIKVAIAFFTNGDV